VVTQIGGRRLIAPELLDSCRAIRSRPVQRHDPLSWRERPSPAMRAVEAWRLAGRRAGMIEAWPNRVYRSTGTDFFRPCDCAEISIATDIVRRGARQDRIDVTISAIARRNTTAAAAHAPARTHGSRARGAARLAGRSLAVGLLALTIAGCAGHGKKMAKANRPDLASSKVTTIGVNAYLWRASLDSLSFMPLLQTDSNGGVIVTDWYANPNNPGERMKVTVSILDQDLRADALHVAASRQVLQNGNWIDAPVQAATVQKLEDVILTKARDLRRQALPSAIN
jgi:hypothetical protein